jgi:hypothetical protein
VRIRAALAAGIACSLALAACSGPPAPHRPAGSVASTSAPGGSAEQPFRAESATFVSARTGWVLGSAPCGTSRCLVLLRTEDGGASWTQVQAPPIPGPFPSTASGVLGAAVRFADRDDGWVFRPTGSPPDGGAADGETVFVTHDGGGHWAPAPVVVPADGFGIADLEASGGVAQVVFTASPVAIESSPVGTDEWALSPTTLVLGAGPVPWEQLVLQGAAGWVIENDRVVVAGARLVGGAWQPWSPPCAATGGQAYLAASDPDHLAAVCDEGVFADGPERVVLELSDDGGTTFRTVAGTLPVSSFVGPVASPAPGVVLAAAAGSSGGILASFDSGASWAVVSRGDAGQGYLQLGFTTSTQGLAIEADGRMLMTFDGGHQWTAVTFPEVTP